MFVHLNITMKKVLAFINELTENNNRDWFNANKNLYQEALETSGIRELKQPTEGQPPAPDPDRLRRGLALADETIAVEPSFWPAHLLAIDLSNHVEDPEQTDSRFRYALSRKPWEFITMPDSA